MDFAKIVEAYRWTGDLSPKKHRGDIVSDGEEMPSGADNDNIRAELQLDNLVTVGEVSAETNLNGSSDSTADKRLASTTIGNGLKSDDTRKLGGMLERAKTRYESSLSSNWYRPELETRGKKKARKRSRGNNGNSSAQKVAIAADVSCSSSTDIGGGDVMVGFLPLQSNSNPGRAKKNPRRSMKERPSKKRERQQSINNRPESEDSACRDVLKASWSSNSSDMNQPSICEIPVNRVAAKNTAWKRRKICVSGIANSNNQDDISHAETISRFFPPAPTSSPEKPKAKRKRDSRHIDGSNIITDGTLDDSPAKKKIVSKKRRELRACKIKKNVVSNAEPSTGNFPAATELERLEGGFLSSGSDISWERVPKKLRRRSSCSELDVNALGQREISNKDWIPPVSVHALIQEELYEDPWKVLVACMLLNKTSGAQMRKVIWDVFALCPTPEAAVAAETEKLEEVIRCLGLQRKRAIMIQKFSCDYLGKDWANVTELHGIGKYAIDAYAIFCEGRWREVKPEDHKLVDYWEYLHATDGVGYAFKDDREKGRAAII